MKTIAIANQNQYRGVTFNRASRKWQAPIRFDGRSRYLGVYDSPEQAALVRDLKAKEWFGESAILNFPDTDLSSIEIIHRKRGSAPKFDQLLTEPFLRSEYLDKGRSARDIAQVVGAHSATIRIYLHRFDLPAHRSGEWQRRYTEIGNVAGFFMPSSDWHAYWLGFIAADGHVSKGNMVRIKLNLKDVLLLENLQRGLETTTPVKVSLSHNTAQIELYSNPLAETLRRWGIDGNKTFALPFPTISDSHMGAFVRGYFDGDGTVYRRRGRSEIVCRFISGSERFLDGLQACLKKFGVLTRERYRNQNTNAHVLPLSSAKANLKAFGRFIYSGATVALERKREIFTSLL